MRSDACTKSPAFVDRPRDSDYFVVRNLEVGLGWTKRYILATNNRFGFALVGTSRSDHPDAASSDDRVIRKRLNVVVGRRERAPEPRLIEGEPARSGELEEVAGGVAFSSTVAQLTPARSSSTSR
jgi:hypothetical protein